MIDDNREKLGSDSTMTADIETAKNLLLNDRLRVPPYQRPYRWTAKNVRQLLEDVQQSMLAGKKNYRIGSVILHSKKENTSKEEFLDIVDGQQRLTTLFLLRNACDETKDCPLLSDQNRTKPSGRTISLSENGLTKMLVTAKLTLVTYWTIVILSK